MKGIIKPTNCISGISRSSRRSWDKLEKPMRTYEKAMESSEMPKYSIHHILPQYLVARTVTPQSDALPPLASLAVWCPTDLNLQFAMKAQTKLENSGNKQKTWANLEGAHTNWQKKITS